MVEFSSLVLLKTFNKSVFKWRQKYKKSIAEGAPIKIKSLRQQKIGLLESSL